MVAVAAAWYEPMRASPAVARVLVCLEPTAAGEAPPRNAIPCEGEGFHRSAAAR